MSDNATHSGQPTRGTASLAAPAEATGAAAAKPLSLEGEDGPKGQVRVAPQAQRTVAGDGTHPQASTLEGGTTRGQDARDTRYAPAAGIALVAGVFALLVAAVMAVNLRRVNVADPLADARLGEFKARLAESPKDENLKVEVRRLDQQLRAQYFQRQSLNRRGRYILLAGLIVFVLAALYAAALRSAKGGFPLKGSGFAISRGGFPHPPSPARGDDRQEIRAMTFGRWSVAATAAVMVAGAAACVVVWSGAWGSGPGVAIASGPQAATKPAAATLAAGGGAASAAEFGKNWPRFRGPGGGGVCERANIPAAWNGAAGENIRWKTGAPLEGSSSPIVWGNRVFVTGGDKDKREVYCFDADSGQVLWHKEVGAAGAEAPNVHEDTGFAAPTPVTDGKVVCAIFATGEIAAFDYEGKPLWAQNLGPIESTYGYASSLAYFGGMVIVQLDQGSAEDGKSKLLALDINNGSTAWSAPRPVGASWTSPIVASTEGGTQVIACGNPLAIAHEAGSGAEIWRAEACGSDAAPSPIYAGGLVLAVNPNSEINAIKTDGHGDVTKDHVAWKIDSDVPDTTSPLSDGKLLWTLKTDGTLTCWDMKDGSQVYQQDLKDDFTASPSLAGGKLYLVTQKGVTIIAEGGREYKEVARCELGEGVVASPAFADGRVYFRGKKNVYCVGK